ncbi:anti-sigma factor family protein [Klebsiella aerogenes]|uniref:anti-sigma factor family protein n=1 Tax=Klebsiella aerogenes TaxID=548 RepID=UPI00063C311A|nr:membrane protein [Klebsiella aerogenes]KLF74772.1 membrane protein [Klebsiella aerogenes]
MNPIRFSPPWQDEAIVAWLDGEMCAEDARRFSETFARDPQLASRTATLMNNHQPYQHAFAALLDEAPVARMQAKLAPYLAAPESEAQNQARFSRRALIAASLGLLIIGSATSYFWRPAPQEDDDENIRRLEAQYMSLYSAETVADVDNSPEMLDRGLRRSAQDTGLLLERRQLALPEAELKMVRMLRYESTSITQILWLHTGYGPVALCISPAARQTASPPQNEQRQGMYLRWWRHGGYQFALIGRMPTPALNDAAHTLRQAIV